MHINQNIDMRRESIAAMISPERKSEFGQFMTPSGIASFMVAMFSDMGGKDVRLLDAGAGIGSLTAAFIERAAKTRPRSLRSVVWELDPLMREHLTETLDACGEVFPDMSAELVYDDFKHSELIKDILEQFAPRFAPGSRAVYIGDTGNKGVIFDEACLAKLGIVVHERGKMPDVVLHHVDRNWLLLVESVTSVGPVDGKRHAELSHLFDKSSAGLVYVTAFPHRVMMKKFLPEIAWETEVWVASDPDHLIHFNGDRFLGPR